LRGQSKCPGLLPTFAGSAHAWLPVSSTPVRASLFSCSCARYLPSGALTSDRHRAGTSCCNRDVLRGDRPGARRCISDFFPPGEKSALNASRFVADRRFLPMRLPRCQTIRKPRTRSRTEPSEVGSERRHRSVPREEWPAGDRLGEEQPYQGRVNGGDADGSGGLERGSQG
jgi:hypothetical protein